jgi:hypothetical protein
MDVTFPSDESATFALSAVNQSLVRARNRAQTFVSLRDTGFEPDTYAETLATEEVRHLESAARALGSALFSIPESADPVTLAKADRWA